MFPTKISTKNQIPETDEFKFLVKFLTLMKKFLLINLIFDKLSRSIRLTLK